MSFTPLDPRERFYGGQTENCNTCYLINADKKIKYVDVCSLYPWLCKYEKFPVGHQKIYVADACKELDLYYTERVIKCKIFPPQHLYHPILPTKMNKKLMCVLCRTRGLELNQSERLHDQEDRALIGTWVIDEVKKAVISGVGYVNGL